MLTSRKNDFLENCLEIESDQLFFYGSFNYTVVRPSYCCSCVQSQVPTQAMHRNISSKRSFLCGNLIDIDYGIYQSITMLCWAGLVMCNSPSLKTKPNIALLKQDSRYESRKVNSGYSLIFAYLDTICLYVCTLKYDMPHMIFRYQSF